MPSRKTSGKSNWEVVDDELRRRYLLKSRGIIQEGVTCMQSGCQKSALKGVAFSLDRFYTWDGESNVL